MAGYLTHFLYLILSNITLVLAALPPVAFLIGFAVDRITGRRERCLYVSLPGKSMMRYTDRKRTPRGWHRFMQFVILPLWLYYQFMSLRLVLLDQTKSVAVRFGESVFPIASLVLLAVAFISFLRWNRMGPFCYAAYFFSAMVDAAVMLLFLHMAGVPSPGHLVLALLNLEWLLVTIAYYKRRELLFMNTPPQTAKEGCT